MTGYSTSLQNLGKVNNRGWEIGLTSQHTFANGLGYSFNVNYAKNTNEVKELGPGNAPIISSGSVGHAYYITEANSHIDGLLLNRETDAPEEVAQGLAFGLCNSGGGHKQIYNVFKYIDTPESKSVTEFAKGVIGIGDWSEVIKKY